MHKESGKTTKLKRIITITINTQMQLHTTTKHTNRSGEPEFDSCWEQDFTYLPAELQITRAPSPRNQRINTKNQNTATEVPNQATIYVIQFTKLKNTKTQKVLKKNFTYVSSMNNIKM